MQTRHIVSPPFSQMFWNLTVDLLHKSDPGNSNMAARLNEARKIVEIQIIRAVIEKRIDCNDRIEELIGKRQGPCIRVEREDAIIDAGIANSLMPLRNAEPEIDGPHLDAKFTAQEDRRQSAAAA